MEGAGVGTYIALSHLFGFDLQRSTVRALSPAWQYVERWELRSGQALRLFSRGYTAG